MRKNVYNTTSTIVVDKETGEISQVETVKKQKIEITSEPFYMVFIDYMAPIFSLKNGTSKSVLSKLCSMAEFNTGKVSLGAADRDQICEELNIKKNVLSMAIKELCDKKLVEGTRGRYVINPQIFWKGDLKTRNAILDAKALQITFEVLPEDMNLEKTK